MFGEIFGEIFIVRTAGSLMIAAILAAAATPSAHADNGPDSGVTFIRHLGDEGIVPADTNAMVQLGSDICGEFASGEAYPDVLAKARQSPAMSNLSPAAGPLVVQTAVFIICPQAADQLPR